MKATEEKLLESALDYCQKAFNAPGTWEEKSYTMYKFKEAYDRFWRYFIDNESKISFKFISKNMGIACSIFKGLIYSKDLNSFIEFEIMNNKDLINHLKDMYTKNSEGTIQIAKYETLFLMPFWKLFHENVCKLNGNEKFKDLCTQIEKINDDFFHLFESPEFFKNLNRIEAEYDNLKI